MSAEWTTFLLLAPTVGSLLWLAFAPGSWREVERTPSSRRPVPFTQPLGIENTDPMVICPSCRCMGHHSLELVPAKPPAPIRTVQQGDDVIEIFTWQSMAGTPERYRRQCLFCGHVWSVKA